MFNNKNDQSKQLTNPLEFFKEGEKFSPIEFMDGGKKFCPIEPCSMGEINYTTELTKSTIISRVTTLKGTLPDSQNNNPIVDKNNLNVSSVMISPQNVVQPYVKDTNYLFFKPKHAPINEVIHTSKDVVRFSNFTMQVHTILVECDSPIKTENYSLTCTTNKGISKSITLTSSDLNSSSWITSKLGAAFVFTGNYNKEFKPYFEELLDNAKTQYIYNTTGWHRLNNDIFRYYHGSGTIPEIQSNTVSAIGPDKFKLECNAVKLSPEESLKYFISMKDIVFNGKYEVSLPLLIYALLSVLKEFFILAGYEPEFCLFLVGKTGSGKTTLAELISCIFNRTNMKVHCNFNDTISSIEVDANALKDSVMIMDDFYPTRGKEKGEHEYKLERVNRMYGDGKGKARTNASLKETKELNGNGMCLITGEQESDNLSTQVRYLGINVDNKTVNFDMVTNYQNSKLSYCDFFYWFITWISNNVDFIVNLINVEYIKVRKTCDMALKSHKRLSNMAAFFITTRLVFTEYVKCMLGVESQEFIFLANQADNYILEAVKLHAVNTLNTTPEKLFIEGLNELIVSHELKIYKTHDKITQSIKFHGYEDAEKYYFIPETVKECVYNFWARKDKSINYTKNTLYKKLSEIGLLETSMERNCVRNTVNYKFNGKTSRYLVIKKDVFSHILDTL